MQKVYFNNMKLLLIAVVVITGLFACKREGKRSAIEVYMAPGKEWLDSLHKASDTTFGKRYGGVDFYKTEYNVNKKMGTLTQVMLDSNDHITQIVVVKDNKRILFGEYYSNGQMKSKLSLDSTGQFDGLAKYYYENGRIQKEGSFKNGFFTGSWNNYNREGYITSIEKYGESGELLTTDKVK
jgi:hypothetical protein